MDNYHNFDDRRNFVGSIVRDDQKALTKEEKELLKSIKKGWANFPISDVQTWESYQLIQIIERFIN